MSISTHGNSVAPAYAGRDAVFILLENRLITSYNQAMKDLIFNLDANEFPEAVLWEKSFEEGKYAYANPDSDLKILYYGARYYEKQSDLARVKSADLMCDITFLEAGKVGDEFVKTVGHYHNPIKFPEVYEAVEGKIEYLQQSTPDKDGKVNVIWVVAEPGDKVVMIPGYGHVSMNVGRTLATEMDVQKRDLPKNADYSMFKERTGGAFYRTADGLTKNPNYEIANLRIVKPLEKPEWGLTKDSSIYDTMVQTPEKFDWLIRPEKYDFDIDTLFEDIEL